MKRAWLLAAGLMAAIMLMSCAAAEDGDAAMTLMVYLCGSDLETSRGAASADLAEMIAAMPPGDDLRVVVMASGSQAWRNGLDPDAAVLCPLDGEGLHPISDGLHGSMGDPALLSALLRCGYEQFPARRYALLLWDHGAGPLLGVCFDERYTDENGMDGLTLQEIGQALADSPFAGEKLEWIGFDACLMASLETACMAAPYARYMIASQETEPATGWDYGFLTALAEDASGAETGRRVAERYMASRGDSLAAATMSCVELSCMAEVEAGMDALFGRLGLMLEEGGYPALASCRAGVKSAGCASAYAYDLIDLADLLEAYQAEGLADCTELLASLERAVIVNRSNTPFLNGLSVYYPFENKEQYRRLPSAKATAPAGYAAFLAKAADIWLGESLTDWSGERSLEAEAMAGETLVAMPLTQEQAAGFTSARLLVFALVQGNEYQLIYQTDDAALTAEGRVQSVYRDEALFLTDARDGLLTGAIPYRLTEDGFALNVLLTRDGQPEDTSFCAVQLIYRAGEDGDWTLSEALEATEDPARQGKATVRLEDYDRMAVYAGTAVPQYAPDGSLLPWQAWTKGGTVYGYWIDMKEAEWQPAFLKAQDGLMRYAMLEVTDVQSNTVCSPLLAIDNPNIHPLSVESQILVDNDHCQVSLTGAQLTGGMYPDLRLHLICENRTEATLTLEPSMLRLDDTVVSLLGGSTQAIAPGETQPVQVTISGDRLRASHIAGFSRCGMTLMVKADYTETLLSVPVSFALTGDASAVIDPAELEEPVASALWDGVAMELLALRVEDGSLRGTAHLRNTTEKAVALDCDTGYVNGLALPATLTGQLLPMTLPAGCDVYTEWCIYAAQTAWPYGRTLRHGAPLEELGVAQITEVGFSVHHGDRRGAENVMLRLAQPLAWPAGGESCAADGWPVLYDDGEVTVWLTDIRTCPGDPGLNDRRFLYLCIRNLSGQEASLRVEDGSMAVDSREDWVLLQPETAAPGVTLYTRAVAVRGDDLAEPETMDSLRASLTLRAGGEEHALLLTVTTLEPPVPAGSESVYEPTSLLVTVEAASP
ncbi:MAG: clostripain-related cysteine peptidase [Aristaeellaceae bacterium]